uniref:Uncharacterized protein n=1 Tax=Lygus hesperus TaxID=30085 RepID=A0A0K8SUV0_LYGHE
MASFGPILICAAGMVFYLVSASFWDGKVDMTPEDIEYVTYKQNIWPDPKMPKIARVINGTREDKDFPDGSRLTTYVYWYIEAFQTKCKSTLKYLLKKGSKLGTQRIFYECYQ